MMKNDWLEPSVKRVPRVTVFLGLAAGILTAVLIEPVSGVLVLAGAVLAALGFISLKSFVDRYLQAGPARLWRRAIIFYGLRLLLICLIFLTIIFFFKARVLALAAGFSLILVAILAEAVRYLAGIKQWKA
ncbi:MAG: hypothetical protein QHH43_03970 [Candidatus Saccharicenans sp.]|jgi:hypothetical protein|nr:hypothetical protein [Candidatus Saccharicenans sp.]MDH7574899.1 hypothetical protein [Candidatus Saccharicenans sp.]